MAELSEIRGGISSVNSNLPRVYQHDDLPWRKKKKKRKSLKTGEILQGTIMEVFPGHEVMVRLPIGTLRAYLEGKLMPGDTLYLKVLKSEPSLVLKIYGASVIINGKKLSPKELLRLLNIPSSNFFLELAEELRTSKSIILRSEIIDLGQLYSDIDDIEIEQFPIKDVFRILLFMQESRLPFSPKLFARISPLFKGEDYVKKLLMEFESCIEHLPAPYNVRCRMKFDSIKSDNTTTDVLLNFLAFYLSDNNDPSLFQLLVSIAEKMPQFMAGNEIIPDNKEQLMKSITLSKKLIEIIEGQHILNTFAYDSNNPLHFYIPVPYEGNYEIIHINMSLNNYYKSSHPSPVQFAFEYNPGDNGTIEVNASLQEQELSVTINSKNQNLLQKLSEDTGKLEELLQNNDFIIRTIKTGNGQNPSDRVSNLSNTRPPNFSVVI